MALTQHLKLSYNCNILQPEIITTSCSLLEAVTDDTLMMQAIELGSKGQETELTVDDSVQQATFSYVWDHATKSPFVFAYLDWDCFIECCLRPACWAFIGSPKSHIKNQHKHSSYARPHRVWLRGICTVQV